MIDLSQVPFVDGHMHPPLRVRPQTVEEYRWPWFEGLPSEWAAGRPSSCRTAGRSGEFADELGCPADERSVVAATRDLDPPTWLATVCERSHTTGLVARHGISAARREPAARADPRQRRRGRAAPAARGVAGDLIAEGLGFADLLERYDAAVEGARDAGYAGLKSIAAYRSGLAIRRWRRRRPRRRSRASARRRRARCRNRRSSTSCCCARSRSRAATTSRAAARGLRRSRSRPRPVNPLHLRGLLSSDEAEGVHFVVLHAAWPSCARARS